MVALLSSLVLDGPPVTVVLAAAVVLLGGGVGVVPAFHEFK